MTCPERTQHPVVLVTGASSGIGRAAARMLCNRGCRVFAGVLDDKEAEQLRDESPEDLTPIVLDITQSGQIESAKTLVTRETNGAGLAGLVNNAGFAIGGPLEQIPLETFQHQIQVNLIGQLAVTQAFLPLIRQGRGRIVFTGSPSGTQVLPFLGPYAASKAGLKAMTEALRLELRLSGIPVSLVEPGRTATGIWDQSKDDTLALIDTYPEDIKERYAPYVAAQIRLTYGSSKSAPGPEHVARAIVHALTSPNPRPRYYVGLDSKLLSLTAHLAPTRLRDWVIMRVLRRLMPGAEPPHE